MLAKILCLANAFLGSVAQEGAEASAVPLGCLEIPILCLRLAFGVGVAGGGCWATGAPAPSAGLCHQLGPGSRSGAWCRGRAEAEPVLVTRQMLGEMEFFTGTQSRSVRCL